MRHTVGFVHAFQMGSRLILRIPMKCLLPTCLILIALGAHAGTEADEQELRELLDVFMAGASVNDAEVHDRFWAEDLVYTSSSGERFGKARIMDGLADAGSADEEVSMIYSARDVDVRLFGDLAVITFRLVGEEAGEDTRYFFNTGVFEKRGDRWQAVAWQATRSSSQ